MPLQDEQLLVSLMLHCHTSSIEEMAKFHETTPQRIVASLVRLRRSGLVGMIPKFHRNVHQRKTRNLYQLTSSGHAHANRLFIDNRDKYEAWAWDPLSV